jgi:CheY-like chemotaxis protein
LNPSEKQADLILMEHLLPGVDGIDTVEMIKSELHTVFTHRLHDPDYGTANRRGHRLFRSLSKWKS